MVTPGFYENTIHLALTAMMNANPVNKANEATEAAAIALGSADEHQLKQELMEAVAEAAASKASLARAQPEAASGVVARAVVKAAAKAVVAAAAEIAAAVEFQEQQAAEGEVAQAAKKQKVDDKRGQELEQANSLIEELQSQSNRYQAEWKKWKKKYQALAAMLNELGVDNNKIAEHLSRNT